MTNETTTRKTSCGHTNATRCYSDACRDAAARSDANPLGGKLITPIANPAPKSRYGGDAWVCPDCGHAQRYYTAVGRDGKKLRGNFDPATPNGAWLTAHGFTPTDRWGADVALCDACWEEVPSVRIAQLRGPLAATEKALRDLEADADAYTERLERFGEGARVFVCPICEEAFDDECEITAIRQCSRDGCEVTFDGDDGRNCPECNTPFTRKFGRGHADCAESWEEDSELDEVTLKEAELDAMSARILELRRDVATERAAFEAACAAAGLPTEA